MIIDLDEWSHDYINFPVWESLFFMVKGERMKKARGLIFPLALILTWEIICKLHIFSSYIIPSPESVFAAAIECIKNGSLVKNLIASFIRVFAGFLITFAVAFPLSVLLGSKKKAMPYFEPFLEFMRHIPPIAVIPFLILWFGIGEASKLAVIFLAAFFPVFSSTLNGIANCDDKLLEVGEVYHLSSRDKFLKIVFPQAIPSIITGIQLGLGYSWRALMGAELVAASSGIGYMIMDAELLSRTDIMTVGILSIGILGYIVDHVFIKISNRLMNSYGKETEYGGAYNRESMQDLSN